MNHALTSIRRISNNHLFVAKLCQHEIHWFIPCIRIPDLRTQPPYFPSHVSVQMSWDLNYSNIIFGCVRKATIWGKSFEESLHQWKQLQHPKHLVSNQPRHRNVFKTIPLFSSALCFPPTLQHLDLHFDFFVLSVVSSDCPPQGLLLAVFQM